MNRMLQIALLTVAMVGVAAAVDTVVSVPEIDGSGALAAVGLLGGVLLVIRSRRKK
jgi:hypothetical protein